MTKPTKLKCPRCGYCIATAQRLSTLDALCPGCYKRITFGPDKVSLDKIFGRDKITIGQMHSTMIDAIAAGHSHYYTGEPCIYGHLVPRSVKGICNTRAKDAANNVTANLTEEQKAQRKAYWADYRARKKKEKLNEL